MSTSVSGLSGNYFPSPQNGFTTTLASSISAGATTVPLNSVAGFSNGQVAVFVVDPNNSSKQTFTGVVDTVGVQLTSVVWTAGTNGAHLAGATVVDYATATHIAMMSKGIQVGHNLDGTHKSGAVYPSPTLSGTVGGAYTLASPTFSGTPTYPDGFIPGNALATSAITLGYAQITSNFTITSSLQQVTGLSATVTIPSGGRRVKVTVYTPQLSQPANDATTLSLWDGTVSSGTRLQNWIALNNGVGGALSYYAATLVWVGTPAAGSKTYNVGVIGTGNNGSVTAASTSPAFILVELI